MPDVLVLDAVKREADATRTAVAATLKTTDPRIDAMATSAGLTSVASAINANVATCASQSSVDALASAVAPSVITGGGFEHQAITVAHNPAAQIASIVGRGVLHYFEVQALQSTTNESQQARVSLIIDGLTIIDALSLNAAFGTSVSGNIVGGGIRFSSSVQVLWFEVINGRTSHLKYCYTLEA